MVFSKSDPETHKVNPTHGTDFTLQRRIDKAIKELDEHGTLVRLIEYKEASLIEELKEQSKKRLEAEGVEQRLYEISNRRYQNVLARRKMEFILGLYIYSFFFILALLPYPTIWLSSSDIQDFLLPYVLMLGFASFAISFVRAKGRYLDESFKISSYDLLSFLIGAFAPCFLWLLHSIPWIFPTITRDLDSLMTSAPFSVHVVIIITLLAILVVIFRQYKETPRVASQAKLEQDTDVNCRTRIDVIDHDVKGIVDDTRTTLEEAHDLDKEDPWDTKVPKYSSQEPWLKLSERHDEYVETSHFKELKKYIETMEKGNIGIAGVRGYGKTSLMQALNRSLNDEASKKYLTVWLSAPTAVDEKEFLLSILAKLATCVGAKLTGNELWPALSPDKALKKEDLSRRTTVRAIYFTTFSILLFIVSYLTLGLTFPWQIKWPIALSLVYPTVFSLRRLIRFIRPRRFDLVSKDKYSKSTWTNRVLMAASTDLLEELWYERKDMLSSNVSLSYLGGSLGGGYRTEKTREPFTLPHLIQMWDDYVRHVTNEQSGGFGKVIVFIDEVDKIKDVDNIGKFMLILKALYNPLKLFFVVSISEDAFARFRERMSPLGRRDEFDSSFDHTLYIERIDHSQTQTLLNDRILGYGLPNPVILLIWMLSKGNPRDVLRLARRVLANYQGRNCVCIAWKLCWEQLRETFDDRYQFDTKHKQMNSQMLNQLFVSDLGSLAPLDDRIRKTISLIAKAIEEFGQMASTSTVDEAGEDDRILSKRLRTELLYTRTVYDLFCFNRDQEYFRALMENDSLRLIGSALNYLSDRSADQAFDLLKKFRSCAHLGDP